MRVRVTSTPLMFSEFAIESAVSRKNLRQMPSDKQIQVWVMCGRLGHIFETHWRVILLCFRMFIACTVLVIRWCMLTLPPKTYK